MDEITINDLYNNIIPEGWHSIETNPQVTGFYDTLCIVGSVDAKVMILTKMYKVYDYKDDDDADVSDVFTGDIIHLADY